MSKSVNKVLLLGNVGKDPEVYNLVSEMSLLSTGTSSDYSNARGLKDGGDDFPHYAQYAQSEITRAEVPY